MIPIQIASHRTSSHRAWILPEAGRRERGVEMRFRGNFGDGFVTCGVPQKRCGSSPDSRVGVLSPPAVTERERACRRSEGIGTHADWLSDSMSDSPAYIAGIGSTPWSWPRTHLGPVKTRAAAVQLSLSAGTKALLDAGVSYDDVDHAFVDEGATEIPYTFGKTGIPIQRAGTESGVYAAARLIGTGSAHCVLLIGVDQVLSQLTFVNTMMLTCTSKQQSA